MITTVLKCPVCAHEWHGGPSLSPKTCDGFETHCLGLGPLHPPTRTVPVSSKPSPLVGPYWISALG